MRHDKGVVFPQTGYGVVLDGNEVMRIGQDF